MDVRQWFQLIRSQFGELPSNYMALDIETTGFDPGQDIIINVGHVIVSDCVPTQKLNILINWPDSGLIDVNWLHNRIERTKAYMAQRGSNYPFSIETLRQGMPPVQFWKDYGGLLNDAQNSGAKFLLHGGHKFDIPRLKSHLQRWAGIQFEFKPDSVWDTGCLEKAMQVGSVPDRQDNLLTWSQRVYSLFNSVKWSLSSHCAPKYGLFQKHGLAQADAHSAGFDANLTHLLFEEYRALAAIDRTPITPVEMPPPPLTYGRTLPPLGPSEHIREQIDNWDDYQTRYDFLGP